MSDLGLVRAREEVAWFFASSTAAMGLHAQTYEGGGGGAVWDESRINRLHRGMLEAVHRQNVVRYGRVLSTMRAAGPEVVEALRLVYVPFGVVRVSWQALGCFLVEDRQLLGLVLAMPELGAAYARRAGGASADASTSASGGGSAPPGSGRPAAVGDQAHLLQFVTDEVSGLDHTLIQPGHALPSGHVLEPALRAATRREESAIRSYDALRVLRVRGETDEREQYYVDLRNRI